MDNLPFAVPASELLEMKKEFSLHEETKKLLCPFQSTLSFDYYFFESISKLKDSIPWMNLLKNRPVVSNAVIDPREWLSIPDCFFNTVSEILLSKNITSLNITESKYECAMTVKVLSILLNVLETLGNRCNLMSFKLNIQPARTLYPVKKDIIELLSKIFEKFVISLQLKILSLKMLNPRSMPKQILPYITKLSTLTSLSLESVELENNILDFLNLPQSLEVLILHRSTVCVDDFVNLCCFLETSKSLITLNIQRLYIYYKVPEGEKIRHTRVDEAFPCLLKALKTNRSLEKLYLTSSNISFRNDKFLKIMETLLENNIKTFTCDDVDMETINPFLLLSIKLLQTRTDFEFFCIENLFFDYDIQPYTAINLTRKLFDEITIHPSITTFVNVYFLNSLNIIPLPDESPYLDAFDRNEKNQRQRRLTLQSALMDSLGLPDISIAELFPCVYRTKRQRE